MRVTFDGLQPLEQVQRLALGLVGEVLDGGLEAIAEVQKEIGAPGLVDLARRQFEVMGLGAGRREGQDLRPVAAYRPGYFGQREEAGCDRDAVPLPVAIIPTAGARRSARPQSPE